MAHARAASSRIDTAPVTITDLSATVSESPSEGASLDNDLLYRGHTEHHDSLKALEALSKEVPTAATNCATGFSLPPKDDSKYGMEMKAKTESPRVSSKSDKDFSFASRLHLTPLTDTSSKIPVSSRVALFHAAVSAVEAHVVSGAVGIPVLSYTPSTLERPPDVLEMLFPEPTVARENAASADEVMSNTSVCPVRQDPPADALSSKPLSELLFPLVQMEVMARPFVPDTSDNFASAFAPLERSAYAYLFQ